MDPISIEDRKKLEELDIKRWAYLERANEACHNPSNDPDTKEWCFLQRDRLLLQANEILNKAR